jgi:hypothetical protein
VASLTRSPTARQPRDIVELWAGTGSAAGALGVLVDILEWSDPGLVVLSWPFGVRIAADNAELWPQNAAPHRRTSNPLHDGGTGARHGYRSPAGLTAVPSGGPVTWPFLSCTLSDVVPVYGDVVWLCTQLSTCDQAVSSHAGSVWWSRGTAAAGVKVVCTTSGR